MSDEDEVTPESPGQELERAAHAAREALARARGVAAGRGLRPGSPRSRRRIAGEARAGGARPDDRDPQLLGAGLEQLVDERGWSVDVAVGAVMGRWSRIVGGQVAEHCEPQSFAGHMLVVRADSTAWATEMKLLAPTVLRRLAEELGEGVVEQLHVRAPVAPTWRKGNRTVPGRGPRDTYG